MTLNIQIPTELKEIKPFYDWETFPVTNESEMELAGQALSEINGRIKAVENWRKEATGPIKQGIKVIEDSCRSITDPLKKIDSILRGKVQGFMNARQRFLEEEARKKREKEIALEKARAFEAAKTAMTTDSEVAATEAIQRQENVTRLESRPVAVSQTVRSSNFTMAQTKVWTWEITDEAKVPREYLIIDEKRINTLARSFEETPVEIPGITFKQESRIAMRR